MLIRFPQLPKWTEDSCLATYIPVVEAELENQKKFFSFRQAVFCELKNYSQLAHKITEYDNVNYSKIAFMLEQSGFPFLVIGKFIFVLFFFLLNIRFLRHRFD